MKSVSALLRLQDLIQQDSVSANFCENELKWIENRKTDWASDRIRVGVIGVTSSGKSTLINAILGADILSSAVAPSSGQLVCCSYGDRSEIIIHFENGTTRKLWGSNYSRDNLQQFSDERFNSGNEKGVLGIELTSPLFDLGKDVLLVDSPGLDAFGLEAHERLTLESLVPTIDACIYVTTMKTNSDRKTAEILNTVAKYNCPIIIIQNMLDSVRPSPSGDKTSEQVALDHKNRVKRIVDRSNIENKDSVRIIQISAERAKQWRSAKTADVKPKITEDEYRKSNYKLLVSSVTDILNVQRPRIERQRLQSVLSCAETLESALYSKINKPAAPVEDHFLLEDLKQCIMQKRADVKKRYESILDDYASKAKEIRIEIGVDKEDQTGNKSFLGVEQFWKLTHYSSFHPRSLEECLKMTNDAVTDFAEKLTEIISAHNAFVKASAQRIHIPDRDLLCNSSLHAFRDVSIQKKTVKLPRRVERDGLGAAAARGVGTFLELITGGKLSKNWGYDIEYFPENVTDPEQTKNNICTRLEDAYKRYTDFMVKWEKETFEPSLCTIESEIGNIEESYRKKREAIIETTALEKLHTALSGFTKQLHDGLPDSKFTKYDETPSSFFSTKKINVTPYAGAVLNLSRSALQTQHRATARSFVSHIGCMHHIPVLITWDDASEKSFLWQTGISDAIVMRSPTSNANLPRAPHKCLFVLVNTIQYGSALKQIAALKLDSVLSKQDHVVWVVQDFQELLTGDHAAEGLSQMTELTNTLQIPCGSSIYILHENPIYNIAFLKHQFDSSLQVAPHKLINNLQRDFGVYLSPDILETIGEVIRKVHLGK